jgi:tripartite-type tricarboxylate transporter receptor subunit TctC
MIIAASAALIAPPAWAQSYPAQDVHFILAYAPGSGPDLIARFLGEKLRPVLKTVIVENKPGAGGNIASEYVARAKPDGYTLYPTGGNSLAATPSMFKKISFDVGKDLKLVATLARQSTLMVVGPNSPINTVAELTAALRQKGPSSNFGTAFLTARVLGALYTQAIGVNTTEVQYRTSTDWINDIASGAIDFAFIDSAAGEAQSKLGHMKIIASSAPERLLSLPDYPTLRESGFDIELSGWWAVFAPAATPEPLVDRLHDWINAAVSTDDARKFFFSLGNEPWPTTRKVGQETFNTEIRRWADYIRIAKIEPQG